jgi:hypothetical protein
VYTTPKPRKAKPVYVESVKFLTVDGDTAIIYNEDYSKIEIRKK